MAGEMVKKDSMDTILNSLGLAVLVIDEDQTVIFKNHASKKRFGQGTTGSPLSDVISDKKLARTVQSVLDGIKYATVDIRFQDVVPMLFRVNIARLEPTRKHPFLRAVISFEDISHIREAEQMRSDFVANVSHELRSPLTSLYGFIETLQAGAIDDPQANKRFLDLMGNEAKRMARLIDDLLSLSKIQAIEHEPPKDSVDLMPLLSSVISTLEPPSLQEDTKVELAPCTGPALVIGDSDKLTQVFYNLIENAIKYSRSGTVVRVRVEPDEEPGKCVVHITDTGAGIEPKHIPRLTERFYRVDKGRSRKVGGTGLGLAIVKHILVGHRGKLRIESTPDVGSTFSVVLPRP